MVKGSGQGNLWDDLRPGDGVLLRAVSPLYRDEYPLQVVDRRNGRLEVSFPMKEGRMVFLPVGTPVSLRAPGRETQEMWTKVVQRSSRPARSMFLAQPRADAPLVEALPGTTLAPIVALVSGKGGVGTTVLAANLAVSLALMGKRTCLIDAVPGLGNADVLLNVQARLTLSQVIRGERTVFEAVTRGPGETLVLAAGDPTVMGSLGRADLERLAASLAQLSRYVDVIVMDAGTGANRHGAALLALADERILVTTPEPHAVTDGYALLRAVAAWVGPFSARLVINQVQAQGEESLGAKMRFAAERFLGVHLEYLGSVPRDRAVEAAVRRQRPFVLDVPRSPASTAVSRIARALVGDAEGRDPSETANRWARWRLFWRRTVRAREA